MEGMPVQRWSPNVTVAALIHQDGRWLLVEERTPEGLMLNNPAGHLDPAESPLQAVVRETREETGRIFTPEALVGVYLGRFQRPATGDDVTYLRFAFCGTVGERLPGSVLDTPVERTLWMTAAEVAAEATRHRSPLLARGIADFDAGCRYPLDLVVTHPSVFNPEIKG
jgi:8-oxo-dGTP pyrophosphatase MutT (NUDIX family)